jgi:hypothetical protein
MKDTDGRTHVILVPGFGGFDMLGQIEYYAGTTALFESWRRTGKNEHAVLHYFDNLPTAGVVTRARHLKKFLAKLIARNIVNRNDSIVLIGHSTGGLDIRQLLLDLTNPSLAEAAAQTGGNSSAPKGPGLVTSVDGGLGTATDLPHTELRKKIRRVIFLSVPQRGTNIADWLRVNPQVPAALLSCLRFAVDSADVPVLEQLDIALLAPMLRRLQSKLDPIHEEEHSGWFAAALDVHSEMARRKSPDATSAANARSARADFERWLNSMHGDFLAIGDLSAGTSASSPADPAQTRLARFNSEERELELKGFRADERKRWGAIDVRSYATLSRCPFERDWFLQEVGKNPARSSGLLPRALRQVVSRDRAEGTSDALYRLTYWLCATGPFAKVFDMELRDLAGRPITNALQGNTINAWDNDGIVNTASMLWPNGEDTQLVSADHGDIIGHYDFALTKPNGSERKFARYDIFKSSNRGEGHFDDEKFRAVWFNIFDFAVLGKTASAPVTHSRDDQDEALV